MKNLNCGQNWTLPSHLEIVISEGFGNIEDYSIPLRKQIKRSRKVNFVIGHFIFREK